MALFYRNVVKEKWKHNYGTLFINYQLRGGLGFPIVVCNHNFEVSGDDRDRIIISNSDSICAIKEVFRKVNAEEAFVLLEICQPCWKNTCEKPYSNRSWYEMLEILIDKIANAPDVKRKFLDKYQHKLIITGFDERIQNFYDSMEPEKFGKR